MKSAREVARAKRASGFLVLEKLGPRIDTDEGRKTATRD